MMNLRGTPRQDIPVNVFRDAALYEDVFDKEGSLFRRQTDKFNSPLSSRDYNRYMSLTTFITYIINYYSNRKI